MFYVRTAFRNIRRYKYKSILHMLIGIVVILFLDIYAENLVKSREQILGLADKIPVEGRITNLQGSRESGLFIKESYYDGVMKSDYVKEPKFTLQLIGRLEEEECAVMAVNSLYAIGGVKEEMLVFQKKEDAEEFFTSNRKECLVTLAFLEKHGMKVGDALTLDMEYYQFQKETHTEMIAKPLEQVRYTIAGTIADTFQEDLKESSSGNQVMIPEIMIPMETARDSFRSRGIPFYTDSGSFYVKNPLELEALKAEMDELDFFEVVPTAQYAIEGFALLLCDETFIRAYGSLGEGYEMLRMILPGICVTLAGAGFITSYLLAGSRRQEYAVMRSLGVPAGGCLASYLIEHGTIELTCGFVGSAAAMWLVGLDFRWALACFAAFFLCFFAGTVAAVVMFGKMSVVEVLAKSE
ncbi:hypothetical protein ABXS75_08095 [Roseburia hominis]